MPQTVTGLANAYGMGADLAAGLAAVAILFLGDITTETWSIGRCTSQSLQVLVLITMPYRRSPVSNLAQHGHIWHYARLVILAQQLRKRHLDRQARRLYQQWRCFLTRPFTLQKGLREWHGQWQSLHTGLVPRRFCQ